MNEKYVRKHWGDGPALAAMLAAGIGCAVIGIVTVLAEKFSLVKESLNWWSPAGPLTGKTGSGVIIWLLSWFWLHLLWQKRDLHHFNRVWKITLCLITLGLLGTFPPFFELFATHP